MKRIFTFLVSSSLFLSVVAQTNNGYTAKDKNINKPGYENTSNLLMSPYDTLNEDYRILGIDDRDPIYPISKMEDYGSGQRIQKLNKTYDGYYFGTGNYNADTTKLFMYNGITYCESYWDLWAQAYLNDDTIAVVGAVAVFNAAIHMSEDTNTKISVFLMNFNPKGGAYYNNADNDTWSEVNGPKGKFISRAHEKYKNISALTIDTTDSSSYYTLNAFYFDTIRGFSAGQGFVLCMDFDELRKAGDSCALRCTNPGSGGKSHYTYYYGDQYFTKYKRKYPVWQSVNSQNDKSDNTFDCNMALYPIVDAKVTGVEGRRFYEGMKLSINPNPVNENAYIQYAIEKNTNVSLDILDVNGRKIKSVNEGNKSAGLYSLNIDVRDLKAGSYLVSLNSNGQRLIKKIIIQ